MNRQHQREQTSLSQAAKMMFVLIAAFFACVWLALIGSYIKLALTWTHVTGEVTEYVYATDPAHEWNKFEYGLIHFVDAHGQSRRVTDTERTANRGYFVADPVSVFYNPEHPEQAQVSPLQGKGFAMIVFTIILMILGTIAWFLAKEVFVDLQFSSLRSFSVKSAASIGSLILANAVPILGVLFFHWSLFHILFLYWAESGVIGVYTVLKLIRINVLQGLGYSLLFLMQCSFFLGLHLVLLMFLYGPEYTPHTMIPPASVIVPVLYSLRFAIFLLFVSHGTEFVKEFLGKREYLGANGVFTMMRPFARIAILQLVLVVGSFLVASLHQPVMGLVLLVVIKTVIEVFSFLRKAAQQTRKTANA
jgi:hypothetical protein